MPPKTPKKVTRSSASRHKPHTESLGTVGSPPTGSRRNKKSKQKQASLESPKDKGIIPQVVTVTKEAKTSEDKNSSNDDNSTEDESALLATNPVTMAGNLTPGADIRLDKKLDHVLEEFLLAKGEKHEIRQMFNECNVYQFDDFVDYELEHIQAMKRKQHNTMKGFDSRKVTQVYNVICYYNFLLSDPQNSDLAEDPENWVWKDFKLWKHHGRHPTVASATAASANAASPNVTTTANTTAPPATVCPDTKKAENAWLSWQRSRRDVDKYPILPNDREYSDWAVFMKRQFEEDQCSRLIDDNFLDTCVKWGPDDVLLYNAQKTHMSMVLERVLQTSDGKRFNRKNKTNPREVWRLQLFCTLL